MSKTSQILVLLILVTGVSIFLCWLNDDKQHKDLGLWAYVPYEFWAVNVENDIISNANNSFRKGQPCVLEFGGKVTIVKVSAAGRRYMLRYEGPDGKNGSDMACGNGTLYKMVGRPNLYQMTKNYLEALEAIREEMSNIVGALNSAPADRPFIVKEDAFVLIKNLNGVKNQSSYREFNETCLIRAGGHLIPLGKVKTRDGTERLLHEYWNPIGRQGFVEEGIDVQCGNGTLLYH